MDNSVILGGSSVMIADERDPLRIDGRRQFAVSIAEYWATMPELSAAEVARRFGIHVDSLLDYRSRDEFKAAYKGMRQRVAGDISTIAAAGRRYFDERALQYAQHLDHLAMNAHSETVQFRATTRIAESLGVLRAQGGTGLHVSLNVQAQMFGAALTASANDAQASNAEAWQVETEQAETIHPAEQASQIGTAQGMPEMRSETSETKIEYSENE